MDELERLRAEVAQLRADLTDVTRERDILLKSTGTAATTAFAANRRPTGRRKITHVEPEPELSLLVRLASGPQHGSFNRNPHEGMILCRAHLDELVRDYGVDATHAAIPEEEIDFLGHQCGLCGVPSNPDLCCGCCDKHLHPQWPAVYCSSRCALNDL